MGFPAACPGLSCRDRLLDAAEAVIIKSGIGSLTLDAVAAQAGVSKGGLLYHFPTKDALIETLVTRICENWRTDYTEAISAVPPGPGRVPRGLMSMCIGTPEKWDETLRRSSVVLVAALANNPALAKPLRDVYRNLFSLLKDDPQSATGELVVLALNGLWFEFIFGLQDMSPERLRSIRDALDRIVSAAPTKSPAAKPTKPKTNARRAPKARRAAKK